MGRHAMYSTARWRKLRLEVIKDEPVCVICNRLPTTVVDHIIAHKGDEALMWGRDNLRGVCKSCHDHKTATVDNPNSFGRWKRIPTFIKPPIMPVTLVCGPTGSGVTEYVQANKGDNDIVIDPTLIAAQLSGEEPNRADMSKWLTPTMLERNNQLAKLSVSRYDHAWVVIDGARAIDRRAWKELLNAEVIVLETSLYTCEEAIRHSPRFDRKADIKSAQRWWNQYCSDPTDKVIRKS